MSSRMKKIFVCHPFRGDIARNTARMRSICAAITDEGHMPIAPALLFPQFMDDADPDDRHRALEFCAALVRMCDEVWCYDANGLSEGMARELVIARAVPIPIVKADHDDQETGEPDSRAPRGGPRTCQECIPPDQPRGVVYAAETTGTQIAILRYDLTDPDAADEHRTALDGWRWRMVVRGLDEALRSRAKYGSEAGAGDGLSGSLSADEASGLRATIYDLCREWRVDLED